LMIEIYYEFVCDHVGIRTILLCCVCVYSICYDVILRDKFS
jgi:hypothetical protein